ncbi:MAG: hypothetical protein JXL20_11635 [Deltaproteobacteria bacterium]|nr:hypothetical protein [Deltaproteobacteria bacterium]
MKLNKKIAKFVIILLGIFLAAFTELSRNYPDIWYILWALFPYTAYYLTSLKLKSVGAIIGGGIFILGIDILIHIQIFYFPGSSTDSIALLTMPFWEGIIIMPTGFLFGWIVEKMILRLKGSNISSSAGGTS